MNPESAPILTREQIAERVSELREQDVKIVLANGCFDLFHVGHIRYLSGAKELGDYLIVGINSDKQVKKLKGENRPFMPEDGTRRNSFGSAFRRFCHDFRRADGRAIDPRDSSRFSRQRHGLHDRHCSRTRNRPRMRRANGNCRRPEGSFVESVY